MATEAAEITARIARCHFAISGGSAWSLELACVGVPQLLIVQAEAHWPTAQRLEEEGAATCLGWHESVSVQTIRMAIQNLLGDPLERQAMSRCGRQLIDGRGPEIIFQILLWRKAGYAPAPVRDGWQRSRVFGRSFRLTRKKDRRGAWKYRLLMKG